MKSLTLSFLLVFGVNTSAADLSVSDWEKLTPDEKIDAVFYGQLEEEEAYPDDLSNKAFFPQLNAMVLDAANNIDTEEIEQNLGGMETIVTIGDPELSHVTLYSIDSKTVVIGIHLYQYGGATENDELPESWHYESMAEAQAGGIDTSADVSWSGQAQYLWNGEEWQALNYTDYEGRGFSWSGW